MATDPKQIMSSLTGTRPILSRIYLSPAASLSPKDWWYMPSLGLGLGWGGVAVRRLAKATTAQSPMGIGDCQAA